MSFGFNKQFKKDETVSKLKSVQDLKETQLKTRQLETDKKKMEERLEELRQAMEIEKEERAKRSPGGAFWAAGVEGPVINHAQNLMTGKETVDLSKVKKIVVLKDEPSPPSSVSSKSAHSRPPPAPGTLAHIASRSAIPHPKVLAATQQKSSSSCGQCETQLANMHCRECGENFCRGCFASFHVRGALRGHHPVPISAAPPPPKSDIPIPLQPKVAFELPPSGPNSKNSAEKSSKRVKFTSDSPVGSERNTGMFQIESTLVRLRDDDMVSQDASTMSYDEQNSNRSFADEWSAAVNAVSSQMAAPVYKTTSSGSDARSPGPRSGSSTKPPLVANCGTSTDVSNINLPISDAAEIQFTSTGISYKDRLLLNKHRRFELPPPNMFVPKPPPVPSANSRRLRQSREGLSSSTKMSIDASAEQFSNHLDFDDIEQEIMTMGRNGVLIVNGRPGSAVAFGSARWENALESELADDEWMMQVNGFNVEDELKKQNGGGKQPELLLQSVELFDEVVEISDFSEVIESARVVDEKKRAADKASDKNDQNSKPKETQPVNNQLPSEAVTKPETPATMKSRPNSARVPSAKKKQPDQMKKVATKSQAQLAAEFGAHQLSTQPSKELKRVATTLAGRNESPKPVSKAATFVAEASPANKVSDFLLMGVESKQKQEDERSPSRCSTPKGAAKASTASTPRQQPSNSVNYSVYKLSTASWKPFNSVAVDDDEGRISATTPVNGGPAISVNKEAQSPRIPSPPLVLQLRFPAGLRSSGGALLDDNETAQGETSSRPGTSSKNRTDLSLTMSLDETPRNSIEGSSFLGRMATKNNEVRTESASKARVPFSAAVVPSPRSSSRPSSAAQRHGYAQPRTPLQQSIEAWRASRHEDRQEDEPKSKPNSARASSRLSAANNEQEQDDCSSSASSDNDDGQGFCGRLATNGLSMTARSNGGSTSRGEPRPMASSTPRPASAVRGATAKTSSMLDDDEEDARTECDEADEAALRSLTEELKVSATDRTSQEVSGLDDVIGTLQLPMASAEDAAISARDDDGSTARTNKVFLNDDDDFDDKMALAELASELQISSSQPPHPVVHPRLAALSGQGGQSSMINLRLSGAARDSQVTLTSVTSCWASSPSSSSLVDGPPLSAVAEVPHDAGSSLRLSTSSNPNSNNIPTNSESPVMPPNNGHRKNGGGGMVFNAPSRSKGDFEIRQSSLMGDFDDVERQLDDDEDDDDEEEDDN